MNIKELRKKYPMPFPLSALKRALEIDSDEPDIAKALAEYAAQKDCAPTPCSRYYVQKQENCLKMIKISTQTFSGEKQVERLAWQTLSGDLDTQSLHETIASLGENIKIHPIEEVKIRGNVNGFLHRGNYVVIIGLDVNPLVRSSKLLSDNPELIKVLAKNALVAYMEYDYKKECGYAVPDEFKEFFLDREIVFYDSILGWATASFQHENRTMQNYLSIVVKLLSAWLGRNEIEIILQQCEVINLSK